MAPSEGTLLIGVDVTNQAWPAHVKAAIARPQLSKLYVLMVGGSAGSAVNDDVLQELSVLFDCIVDEPTLDLIPLHPAAGWNLASAAKLDDVAGVVEGMLSKELCVAREQEGKQPWIEIKATGPCATGNPVDASRPPSGNPAGSLSYPCTAVGGTFDHLHAGHRLLLAAAALVTSKTVYVGIAGEKLLASKKNADLLEPFEKRSATASAYIKACRPDLDVEISALLDPKEPPKAATMADITALVISRETVGGADKLADMRRDHGIEEPLQFVIVDLVGAESQEPTAAKLSSSGIRKSMASTGTGTIAHEEQKQPLRKPVWGKVAKLNPESKGINLMLKCVSCTEESSSVETRLASWEAIVGDETGVVKLRLRSAEQAKLCIAGKSLRMQNAKVVIAKGGHINVVLDKWALLRTADLDLSFEANTGNDISAVEYEFK